MSLRHRSRLKDFEIELAEARSKMAEERLARQRARERERARAGRSNAATGTRTGIRKHVNVTGEKAATTRVLLLENAILLIVLTASIIGLYMLSMYLLNQTN